MASLTIHLLDGFENEAVAVEVDGREVLRQESVTSQLLLGLAGSFDIPLDEPGPASVRVSLPNRGLDAEQVVDVGDAAHLTASVEGGALVLRSMEGPPGFL